MLIYKGGTVCVDYFSDNSANAICRAMGYNDSVSWDNGNLFPIQEYHDITLDEVRCISSNLSSCIYGSPDIYDYHWEDVHLTCTPLYEYSCPPGHVLQDSTCQQCPENTYKWGYNGSAPCSPCPVNSTAQPGSSECTCQVSKCVTCPVGSVSMEASTRLEECFVCPTGSLPQQNNTACSCEEEEGISWSWRGRYHGFCGPCPANTFKNSSMAYCEDCPTGSWSSVGSVLCNPGKLQSS